MINKNALKQLIATIAIILVLTLNSGTAQESNIDNIAKNNVIDMVVEALNDGSISIVLCKIPASPDSSVLALDGGVKAIEIRRIMSNLSLVDLHVIDKLRGDGDIDSHIFLYRTTVMREGYEKYLPSFRTCRGSEWIILLDSPFRKINPFQVSLMEKYEKLSVQAFLNSNNFFTLYEMGAGGLCTYCPEDAKYPPQFIYSKELVDDFRTIIELQENPSLLSESDDSHDTYYSSLKDDLGKRVFSRLFDNPNQE